MLGTEWSRKSFAEEETFGQFLKISGFLKKTLKLLFVLFSLVPLKLFQLEKKKSYVFNFNSDVGVVAGGRRRGDTCHVGLQGLFFDLFLAAFHFYLVTLHLIINFRVPHRHMCRYHNACFVVVFVF